MTAERARSFHFSTEAQWSACLTVQVDVQALRAGKGIQPFTPYERTATRFDSQGAFAPAVTRAGEIIWRDDAGRLYRMSYCDEAPEMVDTPTGMLGATRIVAASDSLWVSGPSPDALQRYEAETLARVIAADVPGAKVMDIAEGDRDTVLALVDRGGKWGLVRVHPSGHITQAITLAGIDRPTAMVFLRRSKRVVVLAGEKQQRLYWFGMDGPEVRRPLFSRSVAALHPCFDASVLGSDGRDRVFVGGTDKLGPGGGYVLILDADGQPLGDVPLDAPDAPATGIAASRDALLVAGRRGLLRFSAAETVPDGAAEARCVLMTPMLNAPDREDRRRWLRVDASATLPEGSTLDIKYAATGSVEVRDRLNRIAADAATPVSERIAAMLGEPDLWQQPATTFHGAEGTRPGEPDPFSARLFDVREPYVWVCVTLTAAPGARLPNLSTLDVLYPGRTLMEHLPAIYQREEERPGSFLRSLVGVVETTTQGLDRRIAALASHLDPSGAPEPWLDFAARWLGLPWDDGFSVDQKRRVLERAPAIANGRGTRAGLESLLEALVAGAVRRFRVTDATADFGFALVGGGACAGSTLPAMLGGGTPWSADLDARAVIGFTRLPCAGQIDDGVWQLAGRIRVEIAATGAERQAWQPWLETVLREMVPLTARIEVRWVPQRALRGDTLDGTLTLEGAIDAHVGDDAITGVARLPERGARLSRSGPGISIRLR